MKDKLAINQISVVELNRMKEECSSYSQYKQICLQLDVLEGWTKWKEEDDDEDYDFKEIKAIIKDMKTKMKNRDIFGLTHILRLSLVKNVFSMNSPTLYQTANFGTKRLLYDLKATFLKAINFIDKFEEERFDLTMKYHFFKDIKHAFGNTALILSGGASFGFYHPGVIKCLNDHGCMPKIITGSSAGSITASIVAARGLAGIDNVVC